MPKARSFTQQIAVLIKRHGLPAVQNAVEMAAELSRPDEEKVTKAKAPKPPKARAAAATESKTE